MENIPSIADVAQICAIPLAIFAIIVSVFLYRRAQKKLGLSIEFQQIKSPIEIRSGMGLEGDIEILYRGDPVDNIFVVQARLENSGDLPIKADYIVRPISFRFADDVSFLRDSRILDKHPEDIGAQWRIHETQANIVQLRFDLMNPGDYFSFEMTCTGSSRVPDVTAGIEGVSSIDVLDIELMREKRRRRNILTNGLTLLAGFAVGVGASLAFSILNLELDTPTLDRTFYVVIEVIAGIILLAAVVWTGFWYWRLR